VTMFHLFILSCYISLSSQVKSEDLLTSTYPDSVEGLVNDVLNITVFINKIDEKVIVDEIFWEPTISYITPVNKGDSRAHIVKVGENNTIQITSSIIGIFKIKFFALNEFEEKFFLNSSYDIEVIVGRTKVTENTLVNIFFSFGLGFALLIMGMEIEVDQILKVLRRPIGPVVGFCTQFLVMPLLAYLLGYLLLQTNYERLGLLLLGCCPGGVGSNFWTAMLGGDINLSVTMTFFSSISAFAMTSFWIWALGTPLVSEALPIPYKELVIALVTFAIPIAIGLWVRRIRPVLAETIRTKIGRPLWLSCLLVIVIGGVVMNIFFFYLVTWRHLLAGMSLGFFGYACGGGAALLARMERPQIIAVAIETAIQNGGIAFVVLNLTFPSPYSDMALLPILAFFFCSAGPFLFTLFAIRRLVDKITGRERDPVNSKKMIFEKISKEEDRTDIY